MEEEWKTIIDYPKYQISNFGKVLSLQNPDKPIFLKATPWHQSYLAVNLYRDGHKPRRIMVHKLVWQHFGDGRVPDGKKYLVLNHKDETPRNNRIDNLELMSSHKNIAAGWKHVKKDGLPTGVFHTVNKKKFIAKIMHNRRSVYLGTFDKAEHGSFAYQGALKVIEMNQEKQCECPKYAFECSECEEGACTWRDRI